MTNARPLLQGLAPDVRSTVRVMASNTAVSPRSANLLGRNAFHAGRPVLARQAGADGALRTTKDFNRLQIYD